MYPKAIQRLIEDFRRLPGVGERTAERYALKMLDLDDADMSRFAEDLIKLHEEVHHCPVCGNLTDGEQCDICEDDGRDRSIVCVVQEPKDVYAMEKTNYRGVYHVLHGAISTVKGILPDDINIASLEERVQDGDIKEIILATNPTLDGETTALYLTKLLKREGLTITRLASGLPMGANLDYADELTLMRALEGRIKQ